MNRQFRFILHIGTEKTGTTTLQNLLYVNRHLLREKGIHYFSSPGRVESRTLAAVAIGDKATDDFLLANSIVTPEQRQRFRKSVITHFRAELLALPAKIHTVIISSEHLHSRLRKREQLIWLKTLLEPNCSDIQVICYLRRQVDLAISFYSTELKNGGVRTLVQAAKKGCSPENHYYNYQTMLTLWAGVFGYENINPRIFDSTMLQNGDVIFDFMSSTGIQGIRSTALLPRSRHNESLTPLGQTMLRALNRFMQEESNCAEIKEHYETLVQRLRQLFTGRGEQLSFDLAKQLQSSFDASNEFVRMRWFSERESLFEPMLVEASNLAQLQILNSKQLKVIMDVVDWLSEGQTSPIKKLNSCADYLRDMAVAVEHKDLELALNSMTLAHRIRPKGPFINQKLKEYQLRQKQSIKSRVKKWLQSV